MLYELIDGELTDGELTDGELTGRVDLRVELWRIDENSIVGTLSQGKAGSALRLVGNYA